MSQVCGPVWRQSKSALISPPPSRVKSIFAAMGVSRLLGTLSIALVTKKDGRMAVAIDKALIPGSNTPRPPGLHTQS